MARPMSPARKAAKASGEKFYVGPVCKFGHGGERYTSTNACRECVRSQNGTRPDRGKRRRATEDEFEQLMKGN